jgi:hypothetical protein
MGGVLAISAVAVLLPGSALAAGPDAAVRVAAGQPEGDTRLSLLTPAQAAFMALKLRMAESIAAVGASGGKASKRPVQAVQCELDPCEPNPGWPPPSGPPASRILNTKTRQQNNHYFCGPATGQIAINWSRGITSSHPNGENAATNWRKQSQIAVWMKTTTAGTGGANLANGLNHPQAVLKPTPDWVYSYASTGGQQAFHSKVVTDIAGFSMPLILATVPHDAGAGLNYLESWPNVFPGAHHWILLRGYTGLWGSSNPTISYQDTSAGFGGGTGTYDDFTSVMWQVNEWNQGGHIVW